jgi:hypothetical protein
MARIYTVPATFTYTAAGGDIDLLSFVPGANKPIRLRGLRLSQISDWGDAQEEGVRVTIRRFAPTVTAGSGGAAVTPVAADDQDAAAAFTARAGDTTVATTTGTNEVKEEIGWNERNSPFEIWWPDERYAPTCRNNSSLLVVRGETTLADDVTICITAWIEEL